MAKTTASTQETLERSVVVLTREESEKLKLPIKGRGGFQTLLSRITDVLRGRRLVLTPDLAKDIVRYTARYGGGGFQRRVSERAVVAAESLLLRRQLHDKSLEAYVLALETINRLSTKYRIETFAFLICNAWELLLKAKLLLDTPHKDVIYYPLQASRPRHTLSLRDCIGRVFTAVRDPLRKNLELMEDLRDRAVHLVISCIPKDMLGVSQACVMNYSDKLYAWFGTRLSERFPVGMMSLVYDFAPDQFDPASASMRGELGPETADYLMQFQARIDSERKELGEPKESIVDLTYHLAFVKNPKKSDVVLSQGPGSREAYAVEVPSDPGRTHPLVFRDIAETILSCTGGRVRIVPYDLRCVVVLHSIKSGDSMFYRSTVGNPQNQYSSAFVNWLKKRLRQCPDFFSECRERVRRKKLFQKNEDPSTRREP